MIHMMADPESISLQVGTDVALEDAYQSARLCGLNIIAQAKVEIPEFHAIM